MGLILVQGNVCFFPVLPRSEFMGKIHISSKTFNSTASYILYCIHLFQLKLVCLSLKPPNVHQIHSYCTRVLIFLNSNTHPALNCAT